MAASTFFPRIWPSSVSNACHHVQHKTTEQQNSPEAAVPAQNPGLNSDSDSRLLQEWGVSTALELCHCCVRGASALHRSSVIAACKGRQHCVGAASSLPQAAMLQQIFE